jgi:hypothetical protein
MTRFFRLVPLIAGALALEACLEDGASRRTEVETVEAPKPIVSSPPLPKGTYPVQSVGYDDASGSFEIFLLGAPEGHKPLFRHTEVQMARLTDEAIAAGKKSELEVTEDGKNVLRLTPEFQITYVHNQTEEHVDPATGQRETVIVAQQTTHWSPFLSAMTGAMIGNMLFAPRYYYPPPYVAGGMQGYGGVGESKAVAAQSYAQRYGAEPKPAKLSRTGMTPRRVNPGSLRSSGSGAGSSRLKTGSRPPKRSPFGGGGFGRRRR